MRCPHCGSNNADNALFCSMCGADLSRPSDATHAEAGGWPSKETQDAGTRTPSLNDVLAYEIDRLKYGDETQLMNAHSYDSPADTPAQQRGTVLDASIPEVDQIPMPQTFAADDMPLDDLEPSIDEESYGQSPEPLRRTSLSEATVPSMDATVLKPVPSPPQEGYFVVRNTRDYDHDAQSVNVASNAGNFETLHQERRARDGWFDPYARSARKGDVLGEGNSRSKLRPLLAILLIAVVLGAAGAVLTYGMELWGGKRVPYLVGESQATAEEKLEEKGLVAHFEAQPADDAIGKVIDQDPELGTRIPEGSKVTVVIATNRTMPDVVGMTEEEARATLKEAGAELIETTKKESSKTEGTVLEVKPAAGELFVSRSTITLTVAAPFRVPDVIGKKESDAVDELQNAGFETEVTYIASEETVRTVVSTEPAAGEVISEGGLVRVKVSSPYPSDPLHLAEFFDHSSQDVDSYLQKKGFTFEKGYIDSYGNALATYVSKELGNMTFSSQPFVRTVMPEKEDSSNVMATGVPIAGVRIDLPTNLIPSGHDKAAAQELANTCGFKGWKGHCTNKTIVVPSGSPKTSASFVCASGEMDDLIWTVCIVDNGSDRRASVTCAKEGLYSASELEPFDGKVRNYVAYQEAYPSSESQTKEDKKDEKSDKSKDKESEEKKDAAESENKDAGTSEKSSDKQN